VSTLSVTLRYVTPGMFCNKIHLTHHTIVHFFVYKFIYKSTQYQVVNEIDNKTISNYTKGGRTVNEQ